jgi:phage repressor protein C with HTH and peptisase S24 domain
MRVEGFRVGCGEFIGIADVEKEELEKPGLAIVPECIRYHERMFAVRAKGTSMWPKILDGDWCFFGPDLGGTRLNRIVLVEHRGAGMDRYSLKEYMKAKRSTLRMGRGTIAT